MSAAADDIQKAMTHEEISRLGGLRSAENMGPRKLKERAKRASVAGQRARSRCKHPDDRVVERNGAKYCRFCGRKVS